MSVLTALNPSSFWLSISFEAVFKISTNSTSFSIILPISPIFCAVDSVSDAWLFAPIAISDIADVTSLDEIDDWYAILDRDSEYSEVWSDFSVKLARTSLTDALISSTLLAILPISSLFLVNLSGTFCEKSPLAIASRNIPNFVSVLIIDWLDVNITAAIIANTINDTVNIFCCNPFIELSIAVKSYPMLIAPMCSPLIVSGIRTSYTFTPPAS